MLTPSRQNPSAVRVLDQINSNQSTSKSTDKRTQEELASLPLLSDEVDHSDNEHIVAAAQHVLATVSTESRVTDAKRKIMENASAGEYLDNLELFGMDHEINLENTDLSELNLSGAVLHKAKLAGTNLALTNLSFADLSNVDFSGMDLTKTIFTGANLSYANFTGTTLTPRQLEGCQLKACRGLSATIVSLSTLSLRQLACLPIRKDQTAQDNFTILAAIETVLTSSDKDDDTLETKRIIMENASLHGYLNHPDIFGTSTKIDLNNVDLSGLDLSHANLSNAIMYGANLRFTNLISANLSGADLRGADLNSADLSSADLSNALLRKADLTVTTLNKKTLLTNTDLSKTLLLMTNFSDAVLTSVTLKEAIIYKTDLSFSDLSGVNFEGCIPYQIKLNSDTKIDPISRSTLLLAELNFVQSLAKTQQKLNQPAHLKTISKKSRYDIVKQNIYNLLNRQVADSKTSLGEGLFEPLIKEHNLNKRKQDSSEIVQRPKNFEEPTSLNTPQKISPDDQINLTISSLSESSSYSVKGLDETSIKIHNLKNRALNFPEIMAYDSANEDEDDILSVLSNNEPLWNAAVSGSRLEFDSDSDSDSDIDSEIGA